MLDKLVELILVASKVFINALFITTLSPDTIKGTILGLPGEIIENLSARIINSAVGVPLLFVDANPKPDTYP